MSWHQKVRYLEGQIALRDETIKKLSDRIHCLEKHVKYLESVLSQFNNENTPSSQKPQWEKKSSPERINKEKKPIGKPKGSNGGTMQTPNIDEEILVTLDKYEYYLSNPINFIEKIVGDIPPQSKVKWIKYWLAQYIDPATGDIITAAHPNCPKEGILGPNLRSLITLLRERVKISEQQTIEFLGSLYGLEGIAAGTIEAELSRTANMIRADYDAIGEAINESGIKHSDETGQSLNGSNWCMYCFSTQQLTYFFSEEKKNASHIKSRLHDDWNKVLVCDGHSIYTWWHAKQRCWGHATRKDKWLIEEKKTEERELLHEYISGTFNLSKGILAKSYPGIHNLWDVMCLRNRLRNAIKYEWRDKKCQKAANYMENGFDDWFTFMLVPGVEPTNNLNERDIRKHVMKRKVSGAFRSERGLKNHCILLSVIETWRKREMNVYETLIERMKLNNSEIKWAA